jgi:ABC-type branched-subunit amino acid transport system substrate-binding protein
VPRRFVVAVVLAVFTVSCTGEGNVPDAASSRPAPTRGTLPPPSPAGDDLVLEVVAERSGVQAEGYRSYLDGIGLAVDEVNQGGGIGGRRLSLAIHDDEGSSEGATRLVEGLLASDSPALLFVGEGHALSPLRTQFQRRQKSVFLLGGDLYTGRGLFRQAFQSTIPWEWQAHAIARYLVRDRRAGSICFVGSGQESAQAEAATQRGLNYWGGRLAWGIRYDAGGDPPPRALARASKTDAVIVFGSPSDSDRMARALAAVPDPPRIVGGSALLAARSRLPPGTAALGLYTWAGWAEPIRRIRLFRNRFRAAFGRDPSGMEQEGYDAVRLLADALVRTGGAGGRRLINALEAVRDSLYSGFPIELGPDDHVIGPRDQLGLFAVAGPDERVDPWQEPGSEPWRAIMRTFTYDGARTSVLDFDRRVFFPFWRRNQPGPKFFRSRYGIRSLASRDQLH